MAGFGGGRSRGGSRGGSFGGGRSRGGSHHVGPRPGGHHHHHHRPGPMYHRPRRHHVYYSSGGVYVGGSSRAGLLVIGIFLAIFGAIMFFVSRPFDYEKVTAVITQVEEKTDEYGDYYDYELEYDYNSKTYTNTWEDDYKVDVGYEFQIYVDKDNPMNFEIQVNTVFVNIGKWMMIGGGVLGVLGLVMLIFKGKSDDENYSS